MDPNINEKLQEILLKVNTNSIHLEHILKKLEDIDHMKVKIRVLEDFNTKMKATVYLVWGIITGAIGLVSYHSDKLFK